MAIDANSVDPEEESRCPRIMIRSPRSTRPKFQPWRSHVESFTLMALVGDLAGKSVVDLACGEGHYTRSLKQLGAKRVLGVDLSERMIDLARQQESDHPLGIEYTVGDAMRLQFSETFDLAVAAYLLNYAHDRKELVTICRNVAKCLKPGGRFVAVNTNPCMDLRKAPSYRKYGVETSVPADLHEGSPITWTIHLSDGSFEIENYYLDRDCHEEAFRAADFREFQWHKPRVSPQGQAEFGRDYWTTFVEHPPVIFIECSK